MSDQTQHDRPVTRRHILKLVGAGALSLPVLHLLSCGDEDGHSTTPSDADMGATSDMGTTADMGASDPDMAQLTGWATGGTAAMVDKSSYPDPFAAAAVCALTCGATIGPCHTTSPERQDVSDGWDGLPMRLSLRVLNEACEPIEDAIVEIWHTNYKGIYSGQINTMCNKEEEDRAAQYFRGYQRSDATGRVDFDTCYPGWYSGRVVHIHVRVQVGEYDAADNAAAEVITQLVFPDELNASIFGEQTLYDAYGQPDTQLATDNVVGGEDDLSQYTCTITRMSDGAMQAAATLVLRSTSDAACSLQGSGGGGGMPPGGMGF